jgi:hypothetical protein
MSFWRYLLPTGDRRLLAAYAALCCFSLAILWSVTEGLRGPYEDFASDVSKAIFFRQLLWILLGWLVLALAARLPLRHLENLALPLYLVILVLLVVVLAWSPPVAGTGAPAHPALGGGQDLLRFDNGQRAEPLPRPPPAGHARRPDPAVHDGSFSAGAARA